MSTCGIGTPISPAFSIIDSVSKEIYGIATFENGEVKVTGSGFDGILKSK